MTTTKVILPTQFQLGMLHSTTATNTDPVWVPGTYGLNARVQHNYLYDGVTLPYVFVSLTANNTTEPTTAAGVNAWLPLRPVNTVSMFVPNLQHATVGAGGELRVELVISSSINSIAFFGAVGSEMQLEVYSPANELIYDETRSLRYPRLVNSMLSYLFDPWVALDRQTFTDLPGWLGNRLVITVRGALVQIGACIFGLMRELGSAPQYGAEWALVDYLGVQRDEFGTLTDLKTEGPYSDDVRYMVEVPRRQVGLVRQTLLALRQRPTVWIADGGVEDYATLLTVLGVFDDVRIAVAYHDTSLLDIRIISTT